MFLVIMPSVKDVLGEKALLFLPLPWECLTEFCNGICVGGVFKKRGNDENSLKGIK